MSATAACSDNSPKRSFEEVEVSSLLKKTKVVDDQMESSKDQDNTNDISALVATLNKKEKKKYHKAIAAGLKVKIINGQVDIQPKIILRKNNDYASFKDLHNLLFGLLVDNNTKIPRWVDLREREKVKKVIVIDLPICDPTECQIPEEYKTLSISNGSDYLKQHSTLFNQFIKTVDPTFTQQQQIKNNNDNSNCKMGQDEDDVFTIMGSTMYDHRHGLHNRFIQLLQCSLTKSQIKKLKQPAFEGNANALEPEDLILSYKDLLDEAYPLHHSLLNSPPLPDNWMDTREGTGIKKKLIAIDCEMCKSENAFVLTKVALIDENHNIILNEFVKPELPITDYLTRYSGVDEQSLIGVTTTLKDIQQKILNYITGDVILVGHGLMNDLRALQIRHPYIIDTAMIYHHLHGPPYKASLRDLALRYLKKEIQIQHEQKQQNDDNEKKVTVTAIIGHDPIEDAISSLELVKLKLKYGHTFGLNERYITELITEKLDREYKLTSSIIDVQPNYPSFFLKHLENKKNNYQCESNKVATELSLQLHSQQDLVLLKFMKEEKQGEEDSSKPTDSIYIPYLKRIYEHLEPNTAIILITGHSHNQQLERLRIKWLAYKMEMKLKPLSEIPMHQRWSEQDEQESSNLIGLAKRYFVYPFIKN
ncbi:hypothetical protein BJ944DRAFT_12820 [Cunninghamella echinulata]|nr:hypothetical protein BJ944DRAFT_12820 [Cunninghamella echinulata]